MRDRISRPIAPIVLAMLVAGAGEVRSQVVIDASRHHLATAAEPVRRGFAAFAATLPGAGVYEVEFAVAIERSSWVALRQFPQLHTNPVDVLVGGRPTRASRSGALWSIGAIEKLWRKRGGQIAPAERQEARRAFDRAATAYRRIASEAPEGY